MKDWTKIAAASGFGVPDEQMARISPVLTAVDEAFAALRAGLPFDTEPAPVFQPLVDPVDGGQA